LYEKKKKKKKKKIKKKKKKKKKKKHSINENLIMIEYLAEIIILMKYLLLILK